ncbi:MAG: CysZ protein [Flavobacteriales bacterium]|jgi:CysZ protein
MLHNAPKNSAYAGANYLIEGMRLLMHPKLRVYILVPLLVNIVLFVILTSTLLTYMTSLFSDAPSLFPEWLQPWVAPFKWIAWIILGAFFIIIYGYSFNIITNIIAAPFYGLLAQATEKLITGEEPPSEPLSKMIPRVFLREISKVLYFLLRGMLVILLMFLVGLIPLLQFTAPIIGLLWGAWAMSIQYVDYAADNNQLEFSDMRNCLWKRIRASLGFGSLVMGCSMIPIVNIFAMPAAVTGGTAYWVNELRSCHKPRKQ